MDNAIKNRWSLILRSQRRMQAQSQCPGEGGDVTTTAPRKRKRAEGDGNNDDNSDDDKDDTLVSSSIYW